MNFKLKYNLTAPLYATNKERKYRGSEIKFLFAETNNDCPSCGQSLNWDYTGTINSKYNQIAHIYGRRNFGSVIHDGKNKFHINNIDVLDSYENLIILCDKCHKKYDSKPSYDDYVKYVKLKETIFKRIDLDTKIKNSMEYIIELSNDGTLFSDLKNLLSKPTKIKYSKMKLKRKLRHNNVSATFQNDIINDVKYYYKTMKDFFETSDDFEKVQTEYNSVYNSLKITNNSDEIIDLLTNSLLNSRNRTEFQHVYRSIVSFFIMNCEVLENASSK